MTGRDLVSASLRLIGAFAPGEPIGATEATDGLGALNRMVGSWSTEGLLIYAMPEESFSLVANQGQYTMGDTGNFDTARPMKIQNAAIRTGSGSTAFDTQIRIITLQEWAMIVGKGASSTIPSHLYPEGTNPLETLNFWPVPSEIATLIIWSWKQLTQIADLNTDVSLPPGWDDALTYNLAVRLSAEYRRPLNAQVSNIAMETKANIKRQNAKPHFLRCDSALVQNRGAFDIYRGWT